MKEHIFQFSANEETSLGIQLIEQIGYEINNKFNY